MKIAYFSEGGFTGTFPRDHENLRMPEVWYTVTGGTHHPIVDLPKLASDSYDLGIIIVPKNLQHLLQLNIINNMKRVCKKTAFQQEGANWIFQDYELDIQIWFYTLMSSMDVGLCHNEKDKMYYEGILDIPIFINPTLLLDEPFKKYQRKPTEEKVIIGGNLVRYYGGFNSFLVAREFDVDVWAPSMGRKKTSEDSLEGLNHLPWLMWDKWMVELSSMKYAVHLNPNCIAGSFSNNCAYWGIPCIGSINSDTQRICYPDTSVEPDDISSARKIAIQLKNDIDFYNHVSQTSKKVQQEQFGEVAYLKTWNSIVSKINEL
jgi:hypothetical protein